MTPKINKIKDQIRGCTTTKQVDQVAKKHGTYVRALLNEDGGKRTMGIQIINLAKYQRNMIAFAGRLNA